MVAVLVGNGRPIVGKQETRFGVVSDLYGERPKVGILVNDGRPTIGKRESCRFSVDLGVLSRLTGVRDD